MRPALPSFVILAMLLTAYDTNLAWCFYGETCASYMLGHGKVVRMVGAHTDVSERRRTPARPRAAA